MENKKISQLDPYSGNPDAFDIPGVADGQTLRANLGAAIQQKARSERLLRPSDLKTVNGVPLTGPGDVALEVANPFKGRFPAGTTETENLPSGNGVPRVGDFAYVDTVDGNNNPVIKIFDCLSDGVWHDSGRTADPANVNTFADGQQLGLVHINPNLDTGGPNNVPSAEAVKGLKVQLYGAYDDGVVSEPLNLDGTLIKAFFDYTSENETWHSYTDGVVRSGYVSLASIKAQGFKKLLVTMPTGSTISGFVTFTTGIMPRETMSYQQLVDGGYICTTIHDSYGHISRGVSGSKDFDIPDDAAYVYFVCRKSGDPSVEYRKPQSMVGYSKFVDGDVQNMQKANAENKSSLRAKVAPANMQEGYINADGSIDAMDSSVNAQIGTFVNIDTSKTYYASGRKNSSSSYAAICYYDDEDTLLDTDDTMDVGTFTNHPLTLPTGTVKIKVQGHKTQQPAVLYVGEGVVDAGVTADTTEKLKENSLALLAPTRVYGSVALKANNTLYGGSDNAYVNEYDVMAGKVYLLSGHVVKQTAATVFATGLWLDSNDNIVGLPICPSITESAQMTVDKSVVAPYGAVKLRVSGHKADDPNHQRAYLKTFVANIKKDNWWYGKKCVWTGDSLSWGSGLGDHRDAWPHKVCQALGMELKNYAIGGSILAKGVNPLPDTSAQNYDDVFLSMDAFNAATKDTSKQYLVKDDLYEIRPWGIYHYSGGSWVKYNTSSPHTAYSSSVDCGRTPIVDRIEEMDTDADLVVVAIGTNDFYYMWSDFGTMSSRDKTTFYGALHLVCQYLVETYHNKQIVFSNCIKRYQKTGQTRGTWDLEYPLTVSPAGHTLEDYNAAIKEVCAYYSIPVVDMYTLSGLNPAFDPSLFADTNGMHTHPNEAGHIRMAEVIKAFLLGLKKGVDIVG